MATRKKDQHGDEISPGKPKPVGEGWNADFRGYVNLNLDATQKAAFEDWRTGSSPWEQLEAFVGDGVHLSLKWHAKEGCFLASGTQRREGSPNSGLVVTSRGREAGTALLRLLFTLTVLSHASRWEDLQPIADADRW